MKPFQSFLGFTLLAFVFLNTVLAKNDSDSDSEDESNESGDDNKIKNHITPSILPQVISPYGYPYNHPVYMSQGHPAPYGPPMPYYYGYGQPPQQAVPLQPGYGYYPHGGYYNQPPTVATGPQYYPGTPVGTSTINHSLKVNKEYSEDGHHYKPDSSSTE